mmetsp:Transcript_5513/g.13948  ORF Transcript_5513/g.13948 Transcript_5513/m.13948 type:complete len:357 (-) Transcript_5513:383-1453(-)|eukprot:CAMPEP_0206228682 /NCGR_PEP_ID=MMETSP0047_2-20121206/9297_1 /ASSEMBLY_ACC=CAM_ASM_000192 /TAXON_ID=195065 /ORGANISM="Chroomonas mesostigmatica_cf, Strain CCMP1168" /LENGTH=356 /DNA_ID=CAMNT_0053651937 /DNA_START=277 /DNA_END=1347 /DNA_ORIENTATION=-
MRLPCLVLSFAICADAFLQPAFPGAARPAARPVSPPRRASAARAGIRPSCVLSNPGSERTQAPPLNKPDTGSNPSPYLTDRHGAMMSEEAVEAFFKKGYAVIDGAFDEAEAIQLEGAMDWAMSQFDNEHDSSWKGTRDDVVAFVDETAPWLPDPISGAIRRVKGFAALLQAGAAANNEGSQWRLRDSPAVAPATQERPLSVPHTVQLASFAPGGEYIIHSDNSRDKNGERRNFRSITAIAYAQPQDWQDEDEGNLRIWLRSDEIEAMHMDPADTESSIRQVLKEERIEGEPDCESTYLVDISPKAGRVVLFRSTLLHQVCPSSSRPRRAIAAWFYAPQELPEGSLFDGAREPVVEE